MLEVLRVARRGDWALRWFALGRERLCGDCAVIIVLCVGHSPVDLPRSVHPPLLEAHVGEREESGHARQQHKGSRKEVGRAFVRRKGMSGAVAGAGPAMCCVRGQASVPSLSSSALAVLPNAINSEEKWEESGDAVPPPSPSLAEPALRPAATMAARRRASVAAFASALSLHSSTSWSSRRPGAASAMLGNALGALQAAAAGPNKSRVPPVAAS